MSTRATCAGSQRRAAARAALATLLLGVCSGASAATIAAPAFACESGPYAVVLPRHYPSLHVIGKHKTIELDTRREGTATLITRRIEYIGMTAEVQLSSALPTAYRLLSLDVNSRRWNIGPLSVGRNPRQSVDDKALAGAAPEGTLQINGPREHAVLTLRGGRIESVSYRCAGPAPRG